MRTRLELNLIIRQIHLETRKPTFVENTVYCMHNVHVNTWRLPGNIQDREWLMPLTITDHPLSGYIRVSTPYKICENIGNTLYLANTGQTKKFTPCTLDGSGGHLHSLCNNWIDHQVHCILFYHQCNILSLLSFTWCKTLSLSILSNQNPALDSPQEVQTEIIHHLQKMERTKMIIRRKSVSTSWYDKFKIN